MSRMVVEHFEALANQFGGKNRVFFVMTGQKDENFGLLDICKAIFTPHNMQYNEYSQEQGRNGNYKFPTHSLRIANSQE